MISEELEDIRLQKKEIDYQKLNDTLIELDQGILASSILSLTDGNIIVRSIRRGYERKLALDKKSEEMWGVWAVTLVGTARQADKVLTEMEYIVIGRKDFKALLMPFDDRGIIVRLTLKREADSFQIKGSVVKHARAKFLNVPRSA